jgi:hypothetical protein
MFASTKGCPADYPVPASSNAPISWIDNICFATTADVTAGCSNAHCWCALPSLTDIELIHMISSNSSAGTWCNWEGK